MSSGEQVATELAAGRAAPGAAAGRCRPPSGRRRSRTCTTAAPGLPDDADAVAVSSWYAGDGSPGPRGLGRGSRSPERNRGRTPHRAARATAERLRAAAEGICDIDLDALDVELPRGFGRD